MEADSNHMPSNSKAEQGSPAPSETSLLDTCALVKSYRGRRVVDGVSLNVKAGEIVGLLGPNGAGKTTTFYMIVGLISPNEGKVFFPVACVVIVKEDAPDTPRAIAVRHIEILICPLF